MYSNGATANSKTKNPANGICHSALRDDSTRAMAVREKCTQRHLVLKALPSLGIHVDPTDLQRDSRKARPKGTRTNYAQATKREIKADREA
jgi:hypothetical protein